MVLGNGGAQLLKAEEGGGLDHVYMAFQAGWQAVFESSEGLFVASRSHWYSLE